jgi:hypothetical protein
MSEATGEEIQYYAPSPDEFRSYGFPGCKDLGNMFEWKTVHNDFWCGKFDMTNIKSHVDVIDFKAWCEKHKDGLKADKVD